MNTTRIAAVLNFCGTPRTMLEISDGIDGDLSRTRYAVWNLCKSEQLVNLNAGASTKIGGLFVAAAEATRFDSLPAAERVAGPVMARRFDGDALVAVWGAAA